MSRIHLHNVPKESISSIDIIKKRKKFTSRTDVLCFLIDEYEKKSRKENKKIIELEIELEKNKHTIELLEQVALQQKYTLQALNAILGLYEFKEEYIQNMPAHFEPIMKKSIQLVDEAK
ncbi:MAG: hypothetical protein ACRC17_03095 [Culicoidibacterales bacterium]